MAPVRSKADDGMPLTGAVCDSRLGLRSQLARMKKGLYVVRLKDLLEFVAATYSPTWWCSTIGDGELNFSVRNGKRWILTAITATIYVLRKNNSVVTLQSLSLSLCALSWLNFRFLTHLNCLNRSLQIRRNAQRKMSGY